MFQYGFIGKSVTVTEIPTASFSYSFNGGIECGGSEIQFTDESIYENNVTWTWSFGDGNTSEKILTYLNTY